MRSARPQLFRWATDGCDELMVSCARKRDAVLLSWRDGRSERLVFPSHIDGIGPYAGIIQSQILKPKGQRNWYRRPEIILATG
jgi:hypothetical protein